jgi:hypothetical protein
MQHPPAFKSGSNGLKSIPAFSKKSSNGSTVGGGGQRTNFLQRVTSTNAGSPKGLKGLAAFSKNPTAGSKPGIKYKKGPPAFKSHSGAAGKSVPAFSKKTI